MLYRTIAPAAVVCALAAAVSPAQAASVADWRHDLGQLVDHVRLTHPDPFTRVGERTFLRAVEALKDDLPNLPEEQRVVRAMKLMAMIGDAHTIIEPRTEAFAAWYPIRIVEFTDGYFITAAHESIADLTGAQVIAIGGRPVAEAAEAGRDLISADNEWWRRESLYALYNAGLMKGLGLADPVTGALKLRVKLASGRVVERMLAPMRSEAAFEPSQASLDWRFGRGETSGPGIRPSGQYVSAFRGVRADAFFRARDTSRPPHLSQRSLNALPLPERDAYYIMINIWHGTEQESIPDFFARAMREVDAQKPRRLILDLRYATGGDGSNGWPVIRELLARKYSQPWKELYVLVSGRTYSASLNTLGPLLFNVPATLVGEPMGGGWLVFGDYSTFQLERIGIELRVSALRHQMSESTDLRTVLPVDYPAQFSFADWVAGRDPAVDPILSGEEVRGIAMVALADGGAAARRVYLERQGRFGHLSWWGPPTERELRVVGLDLKRAGRTAKSIETFRLASEIHPAEWRSWFNLGNALRADGQIPAALEAYRRCLALNDPTNFNQAFLTGVVRDLEAQSSARPGAAQ